MAKTKDNVNILMENFIFYAIFFIALLLIASFGLIAEA
jgi:hypothetical protein